MSEMFASYILFIRVRSDSKLRVGSLGNVLLKSGAYAYIGSAKLRRPYLRVLRHFKRIKKIRWHIDYLTTHENVVPELAIVCINGLSEDGIYSEVTEGKLSSFFTPVINGFGCSDTKHKTHLFSCSELSKFVKEVINYLSSTCEYVEIINS